MCSKEDNHYGRDMSCVFMVRIIIMAETCHVCSSEGNHYGRDMSCV